MCVCVCVCVCEPNHRPLRSSDFAFGIRGQPLAATWLTLPTPPPNTTNHSPNRRRERVALSRRGFVSLPEDLNNDVEEGAFVQLWFRRGGPNPVVNTMDVLNLDDKQALAALRGGTPRAGAAGQQAFDFPAAAAAGAAAAADDATAAAADAQGAGPLLLYRVRLLWRHPRLG